MGIAKKQGLALTGPDGVLTQHTNTVIETGLDEESTEHFGYGGHDTGARDAANSLNGVRAKTVPAATTAQLRIDVLRGQGRSIRTEDRRQRQRRLTGVDELVLPSMPRA